MADITSYQCLCQCQLGLLVTLVSSSKLFGAKLVLGDFYKAVEFIYIKNSVYFDWPLDMRHPS